MILDKLMLTKAGGECDFSALRRSMKKLEDGDYAVFICNKSKNKTMPQLKYLFGIVLKEISNNTGYEVNDLYRMFEKMFAPKKVLEFNNEEFITQDAKNLNAKDMGAFIEKIIHFASEELGIEIVSREDVKSPEAQGNYVDVENDYWTSVYKK